MISLINNQHLLPFKHSFVFLRRTTNGTLFFLIQILNSNILSDNIFTVEILLPPLQVCPKCNNSVGCFRVRVPGDSLLTSDRHGHPLLWSEELETHHQIILMRGETAGSNHCSATWLAQLVHIINPNHHLAKASTYLPPVSLRTPRPDYLPHCGP